MTTASPLYRHRALLLGVAHLSPTGKGSLRLEAQGLFTKRARPLGRRHLRPGLYQVALWPRTDLEGFVSSVTVASWSLLRPAPIGEVPSTPLRFTLLGEWQGEEEGLGRVLVVPLDSARVPSFSLSFLLACPPPPIEGAVVAFGRVERGRLVAEGLVPLCLREPGG